MAIPLSKSTEHKRQIFESLKIVAILDLISYSGGNSRAYSDRFPNKVMQLTLGYSCKFTEPNLPIEFHQIPKIRNILKRNTNIFT